MPADAPCPGRPPLRRRSPLAALQQAAGNAAVTRAIQRARDEERAEGQRGGPEGRDAEAAVPVQRRASVVDAVGSLGRPLESRILQHAEQAYDMDFGHVRVHSGPVARRSAEDLDALAYTTGSHIVLGGDNITHEVMYEEVDHVRRQSLGPVPAPTTARARRSPTRTTRSRGAPAPTAGSRPGAPPPTSASPPPSASPPITASPRQ